MNSDRMAVLPGPPQTNEINDLKCQPGVTAHTEPKGRIGEVSTRLCWVCDGTGWEEDSDPTFTDCHFCDGEGVLDD